MYEAQLQLWFIYISISSAGNNFVGKDVELANNHDKEPCIKISTELCGVDNSNNFHCMKDPREWINVGDKLSTDRKLDWVHFVS